MCCELRKGRTAERLSEIVSDFPNDLDEYFHQLIFDRIGRSRRNVEDTAAALKLALVIHASEQTIDTAFPRSHPSANSYMNFWLLRDGHLKPGFSWMDNEGISQLSTLLTVDQTTGYLEETCKDLLVLDRVTKSVGFLHRTVFDFLSDNNVHDSLEQHAPRHFSSENFVFDLARLRCLCLLRTENESCRALTRKLGDILGKYQHLTHMEQHVAWLSKVESVAISQMRDNNGCAYWIPVPTLEDPMPTHFVEAGLRRFLLELHKHVPALALDADARGIDLLGVFLLVADRSGIRNPDLLLLQHILETGCNPNTTVGIWYPFESRKAPSYIFKAHKSSRYIRTAWTAWLGETFTHLAKMESISEPNEVLIGRKRQAAAIIARLVQHGADPHCMVCITRHYASDEACRLIVLDRLIEAVVPADQLTMLRDLRELCTNPATFHTLRRNQRRRAVRSLQTSEQFYERFAKDADASGQYDFAFPRAALHDFALGVLRNIANVKHGFCDTCQSYKSVLSTANWCLDCGGRSILCYYCLKRNHFELPTLACSYGYCTGDVSTATGNHTSVTWAYDTRGWGIQDSDQALKEDVESIRFRYAAPQAIAIMKEWYAKDPIDPGLSFEDVVRSTRAASPLPPPDQPRESGRVTEEVLKERGGKSNRAWSSLKRFVRRR
jgi:hypothetical protein